MTTATAAPNRSRQYVQRRINLHQGKIANLDTRAAAIEDSVRCLAALPSSKAVVKRLDGQYNPNLAFDELRESDNVTVIPVITSLAENYPERQPNTSYKLRHSVVANYADEPLDSAGKQHPRFLPVMGRAFSIQSDGPVDWSQGLKDGYVQIGKQSLVFLGELKGPWQPATQYKFGDSVVVQAKYAPFMGMPAGQTQLFVFHCVRDHTSGDLASYVGFWDLSNDYLDASGNPTVPTDDVDFGRATHTGGCADTAASGSSGHGTQPPTLYRPRCSQTRWMSCATLYTTTRPWTTCWTPRRTTSRMQSSRSRG